MKCDEINIRDPFVLVENGKYYLYGTRAKWFGSVTAGFDVYVSDDLENWSEPKECFNSVTYELNKGCNWAPEVHKYNGKYYMFATFTNVSNGRKGTYILKSDSPLGPFVPHSNGVVTPDDWECLDGTLYISKDNKPYIVFCHEHTQIIDGTICYARLNENLTACIEEPVTMFSASSSKIADPYSKNGHYVTDGPFMYRNKNNKLFMIWSTFIKDQYSECIVKFSNEEIGNNLVHLAPLMSNDGGHGMIFGNGEKLYLTFHKPNTSGYEHPVFIEIEDNGDNIAIK